MRRGRLAAAAMAALLLGCASAPTTTKAPRVANATAKEQVIAAERAFAQAMADRDPMAFASFLADDAVFFSGPTPLRGKAAVAGFWMRFFTDKEAPFSWEPDEVEVLESGALAHSSGPVRDRSGKPVSRFNSIWRLESPGVWRVVFDKGSPLPPPRPQ